MSRTAVESNIVFQGQLYHGEAKSKSWSPVCNGQVTVSLRWKDDQWRLVAFKEIDKVWEGCVDSGFKHRVRESFVQWQQRGEGGAPETYALRLKNSAAAQQFSEAISAALAAPVHKPKPAEVQETVKLRLLLPGRRTTAVSVPKIITVSQLLMKICEYHQLDPTQHAIALPPATPHGQPVLCAGTMTVGSLHGGEVHLVKSGTTQPASEGSSNGGEASEQTLLLHVELPKGERTVVRVSPSLSVKELLQYVCEKRNLDPATHFFDLPATEESLTGKTLEQLKINNIKVVLKESPTQKRKTSIKGTNKVSEKPADSPKTGRRVAPPPPPPQCRRTQPELMKELAAEMVERKLHQQCEGGEGEVNGEQSGGGEEEVKDEGAAQTDESQRRSSDPTAKTVTDDRSTLTRLKPRGRPAPPPPSKEGGPVSLPADPLPVSSRGPKPPPPPVAEKPRRNTGSKDQDEPDSGPPPQEEPSSISSATLDQIVLGGMVGEGGTGVKGKVKEHAERPEMSTAITEGLKKQAEGGGRYLSIKRKAAESPGTTPREQTKHNSLERPPKRPLDTNTLKHQKPGTERKDGSSLKRRPRGPAPPPPKVSTGKTKPKEENADKTTKAVEEPKKSEGFESTPPMRSRPSRRAPSRPAPTSPQKRKMQKVAEAVPGEPPAAPQEPPVVKQEDGVEPSQQELCETSDKVESSVPSTPTTPSLNPSPSSTRRPDAATATVDEMQDGRKVLIVKPSPHSQRKPSVPAALVFNLPPPPPLELDEQEKPPLELDEQEKAEARTEGGPEDEDTTENKEGEGGDQKKIQAKLSDEGIVVDDKPPSLSDEPSEESRDVAESKVPMSPAQSNLDETILSNEYTNLDDDCSSSGGEQTTDFSCEDNLDPIEDSARTEPNSATGKPEDGESEVGGGVEQGSDTSSEGGYDIAGQQRNGSSTGDSDSVCGYDVADASPLHKPGLSLPPPMPELAINANTNNSNSREWAGVADIPPPSTFVPPPPEQMSDPEDLEGEGGDGVVLVSMVTHREDVPIVPEQVEDAINRSECGPERPEGGGRKGEELGDLPAEKNDSIGTKLNELDNMVISLQKLITETTGTPPPSPPPPRPPPPGPPPPPSLPLVRSTELLNSDAPPKQKSPIPTKPKPPPPSKKPVKPADPDAAQEELFAKLKQRQLKLKAQMEEESMTSGRDSVPHPSMDPHPPVEPHPRMSVPQPSGDMVQMQLQYLQQQVLQQQMVQLQQQFQQMQHMALQQNVGVLVPAANPPFLQQTPVPNPALLGLHHQPALMPQPAVQHPAMVGPTAQPVPMAGFVPGGAHPLAQQPTGLYPQAQYPHGVAASHLVPPHSTPAVYSLAPTSLAPPPDLIPPPPPTTSPPSSSPGQTTPSQSGQSSGKQSPKRRPSHHDVRSTVLGPMEDQFDSLMEEVRDADPNEVLKKVPEEEMERDPSSSSYTGMAAALAEALKQRRMHFTEKRRGDLETSMNHIVQSGDHHRNNPSPRQP